MFPAAFVGDHPIIPLPFEDSLRLLYPRRQLDADEVAIGVDGKG